MITSLPNLLTMCRIIVIPGIVIGLFIDSPVSVWTAFALYAFAGVTDFFDGYLARSMNVVSAFGRFLDPIADKLLVAACIMMLMEAERISGPSTVAALVILCREILVSGLREYLAELKISVPVTKLAKWKTTVQILALGFLMVGPHSPEAIPSMQIGIVCLWLAAILTAVTGYDYMRVGIKHMTETDKANTE